MITKNKNTRMVNGVRFSQVYRGMNVARLNRLLDVFYEVQDDLWVTAPTAEEEDKEFQARLERLATKADYYTDYRKTNYHKETK